MFLLMLVLISRLFSLVLMLLLLLLLYVLVKTSLNTVPCLGQVLIVFRTEASKIIYLVQDSEAKKPYPVQRHVSDVPILGSLSTRVFETRTATGSQLFSLLTCLHTTAFALPSIFCPLEMLGIKIWETLLSWHAICPLPVVVRVSKTCMLKLPIMSPNTGEPQSTPSTPKFFDFAVSCT